MDKNTTGIIVIHPRNLAESDFWKNGHRVGVRDGNAQMIDHIWDLVCGCNDIKLIKRFVYDAYKDYTLNQDVINSNYAKMGIEGFPSPYIYEDYEKAPEAQTQDTPTEDCTQDTPSAPEEN